ncbi:hypothetical protein PCL_03089 [Purpureocillium lilacinum]|uniref:Uncharacterized protein n=1 Tax=Purpureocillium lilacinum TaxID=33203 RepID=A0A2U3DYI6_PURLI|nr:hypothetical protein Purlil1_528 [Purpureocillium lilacinum]PWI67321.1 hypothetical protein PCL_03089 [Purpureocillium lilacinum]
MGLHGSQGIDEKVVPGSVLGGDTAVVDKVSRTRRAVCSRPEALLPEVAFAFRNLLVAVCNGLSRRTIWALFRSPAQDPLRVTPGFGFPQVGRLLRASDSPFRTYPRYPGLRSIGRLRSRVSDTVQGHVDTSSKSRAQLAPVGDSEPGAMIVHPPPGTVQYAVRKNERTEAYLQIPWAIASVVVVVVSTLYV